MNRSDLVKNVVDHHSDNGFTNAFTFCCYYFVFLIVEKLLVSV